jgi:hypothetical protein
MSNPTTRGWTYVVGTYDGNKLYLYVDGVKVSEMTTQHGLVANSNSLNIGCDVTNSQWFVGAIDEVRIYNRAIY